MKNVTNLNTNRNITYEDMIENIEFGVYSFKTITEIGLLDTIYFIVLKEKSTGVILDFTPFSKYLRYYHKNIDTRAPATIKSKVYIISNFLNYIFLYKYKEYGITRIEDVTKFHAQSFLNDYASGKLNKYKGMEIQPKRKDTVKTAINEITRFLKYIQKTYKENAKYLYGDNLYETITKVNPKTNEKEEVYQSTLRIKMKEYKKKELQMRDIPNEVLIKLFKLCDMYYPEIKLALALQAFGGMRGSEVCNCRQEISPKGGTKVIRQGRTMLQCEFDLTRKLNMRSDFVDVGDIKTPGEQRIFEKFLTPFQKMYDKHVDWLRTQKFEREYCPLFINRDGKAMTYNSYYKKFKKLVHLLKEDLLSETDERLKIYGTLLMQYSLSTHALRHWFTVQLVLEGLSPNEIAGWRRDEKIDSAMSYCSKKESLGRVYKKSNDTLFNEMFYGGGTDGSI